MVDSLLKHPKEDSFEILTTICVDLDIESDDLNDCYYTDNIYIAAFLKARGLGLVAIHRCKDKKNYRTFSHFWFKEVQKIKPFILSYHNDIINPNINASGFVSALQSIKKILNVSRTPHPDSNKGE